MESIIISAKRFPVIIFWAFSNQLEIDGYYVEATLSNDLFRWRLYGKDGKAIAPYWEIPRDQQVARFPNDDAFLIHSLDADLVTGFFHREFLRYKEEMKKYLPESN